MAKTKTTQQKKTARKNKADRLLQELGRKLYSDDGCEVCGGVYSCLHHYVPKSVSYALRYYMPNCIPICVGCHMGIHKRNDPKIINTINEIRGKEWLEDLNNVRRKEIKDTLEYINSIVDGLKKSI